MTKPDVIKAAMNVGKFDTSDANLGSTKKGYAVPNDSVYSKEIWNAAIEQCLIINAKFNGTTEIDENIRKLKK